jgi:DNA modification methylase
MNDIKLIQGDCLDMLKEIKSGSIDFILTDPPYGTTACKWDSVIPLDDMWLELKRIIKPNGAIVLFGAEPFSSSLRMSNIKQYKYDWFWEKNFKTGHLNAKKQPMRSIENMSVFYGKQCIYNPQGIAVHNKIKDRGVGATTNNKCGAVNIQSHTGYPHQLLSFNRDTGKSLHPTQKPVALMEYLIKTYTNENETVLDFTMGSGTTGVACINTNRAFIGIELDESYFEIAQQRILGQ